MLMETLNHVTTRPTEQAIYEQMWEQPEYRIVSPGEHAATTFLTVAKPRPFTDVLDLGCGTGRGGFMLAVAGQMNVTLVDFAHNCLDAEILPALQTQAHTLRFLQADLSQPLPVAAPYGFICDVMEHITPESVDAVLNNVLLACNHVYFEIATEPDRMGVLIGHPLHLTVQPYAWWLQKFEERECVIHWSREQEGRCAFYVSAWTQGQTIVDAGVLNTEDAQILSNVKTNIAGGWQQVRPYDTNDVEMMILGSGPSLAGQLDRIKRMRSQGVKLATLNGAYNWAIEQGLTPSLQIVVDAREFNARFTRPVVDDCKYLIASQCHPSVYEGLPHDRTYQWHTTAELIQETLREGLDEAYLIPGGSTVLLRAIPLLRVLGFHKFHLFGCDSCLSEGAHHAFAQPENDADAVIPVNVGDRIFACHPWMSAQASEMIDLIRFYGDDISLRVHGGGLLAWIIQHAAKTRARISQRNVDPHGRKIMKRRKDARRRGR